MIDPAEAASLCADVKGVWTSVDASPFSSSELIPGITTVSDGALLPIDGAWFKNERITRNS